MRTLCEVLVTRDQRKWSEGLVLDIARDGWATQSPGKGARKNDESLPPLGDPLKTLIPALKSGYPLVKIAFRK